MKQIIPGILIAVINTKMVEKYQTGLLSIHCQKFLIKIIAFWTFKHEERSKEV